MILQLFGPRWNPNVPKFAANLGFTPLEPVKANTFDSSQSGAGNSNKPHNSLLPGTSDVRIKKMLLIFCIY